MIKKIKVVHIITKLELGGAQQNTLYTVEHLDKTFFDVYLISGRQGILDNIAKELAQKKLIKFYFVTHLIREIRPWMDILAFIEIFILILKIRPDIIHTHSSKAGILSRWACFFYNIIFHYILRFTPYSFIIHTFHGFGFNNEQKPIVRKSLILSEVLTGKISHKLIFVSKSNIETAKMYKIANEKQIILIRSGIKISKFRNVTENQSLKKEMYRKINLHSNSRVITTIGPFKPQKNFSDFIKLAHELMISKELNEEIKNNLVFLIAGDGEQRKKLELLRKKFFLEKKIYFLSWCKDIPALLSITDIFIMTSLWEGLPRSAVESLVAGVPVVGYSVDGLKDIIVDDYNGYLVEPKNFSSLAKLVTNLLNNKSLLTKLKKNAKVSIDVSFDIDYMVTQQEQLYFSLVKER